MAKKSTPLFEVNFQDYEQQSPWVRPGRPWEKLYIEGVPKTVRYPEIPLHYLGRETARKYPHNLAIYSIQDQRKYTYLELMHYSDRIAAGLSDLGVKKGDGVGLYMINSPEFIFSVYGISQTGAVIVPLNPMLKAPDIEHIARDSGILKTVICSSIFQPIVEQVGKQTSIEHIIVHGQKSGKAISLEELIENHPARPPVVEINPREDLCVLLYTGGTTGAPKGVMITHYNLTSNVFQMAAYEVNFQGDEDIKVSSIDVLPMCHSFGFSQVQLKISLGTLMMLYNGFNPEQIMQTIEMYQAESFIGIPLMFQMLINELRQIRPLFPGNGCFGRGPAARRTGPEMEGNGRLQRGAGVRPQRDQSGHTHETHLARSWPGQHRNPFGGYGRKNRRSGNPLQGAFSGRDRGADH
jgi:long-chain acyl-CoA synthetase